MDLSTGEADRMHVTQAFADLIAARAITFPKGRQPVWEVLTRRDPPDDILAARCRLTERLEPGALAAIRVPDWHRSRFERVIAHSAPYAPSRSRFNWLRMFLAARRRRTI